MTAGPVVEFFAGAGGISEALRLLGVDGDAVGYEVDEAACATALAAGHKRVQADVSMLDLRPLAAQGVWGFCAGPPCQSYSAAGKQKGKLDRPRIEAHIERVRQLGRWAHYSRHGWHDPRSPLVLEVLRFALEVRPEWIVLEQVPQVLPLWELVAVVLREHGWSVDTAVLKAEQYGVPQTRKRAILAASRRAVVALPVPTHRPYRKGVERSEGDPSLLPWVSMADALGWGLLGRPSPTITAGGTDTGGAEPIAHLSRYVPDMVPRSSAMANATVRHLDEPAPTITAGHDRAERVWQPEAAIRFGNQEHSAVRSVDEPAATVRFSERVNAIDWVVNRPAPTVVGTRRSSEGMLIGRQVGGDPNDASQLPAVRVTVQEAAVLQSFCADYPWQGSKSAQYRQVGDAAPPLLMAAVIAQVAL